MLVNTKHLFFIWILLFFSCISGYAQTQSPSFPFMGGIPFPEPSDSMPDWFQHFHQSDLNVLLLIEAHDKDKEGEAYSPEGEEEHNPYEKYYSKFIRSAIAYVLPDGRLQTFTARAWNAQLKQQFTNQKIAVSRNTTDWEHIGPKETFWLKDDNANQPEAPWQTNIYCFDIAPSNPSILYAGSETEGLYKTTDKGLNWVSVSRNIYLAASPTALAIHPTNPDIVYVGAGWNILKTTNGGQTWDIIYTINNLNIQTLAIHPSNAAIILAAGDKGLYRTSNSGQTWTQIIANQAYDVAFKEDDPTKVFVISRNPATDKLEFQKSLDTGVNFSLRTTGWTDKTEGNGARMATTPANATYIYINYLTTVGPSILKSTDTGESWTEVAVGGSTALEMTNGQGFYDLDILVSPNNAEHIIAATTTAYKSTNGGLNYTNIGGYGGRFEIHPDIQEMVCAGGDCWIATDGGINYSNDFFQTHFEPRFKGIDGTDLWGYDQGWNEDVMVGGRYHNGNMALHENFIPGQALRMGGAEEATGYVLHGRPNHVAFSDLGQGYILGDNFNDYTKGRFEFSKYPNEHYLIERNSEVLIHPLYYKTYYVGKDNSLWISKDGGISFDEIYDFGGNVRRLEIGRDNHLVLYVGVAGQGLFKTTDGGNTWQKLTIPNNLFTDRLQFSINPEDANTLWLMSEITADGMDIFKTTDGGSTWTNLSTNKLNGHAYANVTAVGGTNGGVYLTARPNIDGIKVFYRDNTMSDWVDYTNGLPKGTKPLKTIPFYRDGKLRLAGNRGVWQVDLYQQDFTPIIQPSVDRQISYCNRDTFYFDDYSILNHSGVTWEWEFPGASYISDIHARNPKVTYDTDGDYMVNFKVIKNGQTYVKNIPSMVTLASLCNIDEVPGSALLLTGNSNDAMVSEPLNLNTNTVTMMGWIKRDGVQPDFSGIIFCDGSGTTAGLNFYKNNALGIHWDGIHWNWNSRLIVPDGEWTHVALVVEPDKATIYMNGIPSTRNSVFPVESFSAPLSIGIYPNRSDRRMKGLIDEVAIYNKAFTQEEIRATMHLTKTESDTNLVSYWQFNEDSGQVLDKISESHGGLTGNASRIVSTAPVGKGVANRQTETNGNIQFVDTHFEVDFLSQNGAEVVVTKLQTAPNIIPSTPLLVYDNQYWIAHRFGNGNLNGNISFTLSEGLSQFYEHTPSHLELYGRATTSDQSWQLIGTASQIDASNNKVTFNNISTFEQYVVAAKETEYALWLSADKGVTTSGTVNQWEDQSGRGLVATATSGEAPNYLGNAFNFNPALQFTNHRLTIPAPGIFNDLQTYDDINVFAVFKDQDQNDFDWFIYEGLGDVGAGFHRFSISWNFGGNTSADIDLTSNKRLSFDIAANAPANQGHILSSLNSNKLVNGLNSNYGQVVFINGQEITGNTTQNAFLGDYAPFQIGDHDGISDASNSPFSGELAELIIFTNQQSNADREKIETYLGLKYGITLNHPYIASNDMILWNPTAAQSDYSHNIAGIGKDSEKKLNQKQAKSINNDAIISMGANKEIAPTNVANTANLAAYHFLLWGNNDLPVTNWLVNTITQNQLSIDYQRIERIWLSHITKPIGENNSIDSMLFSVSVNHSNLDIAALPVDSDGSYYLMLDDDGDFTNGGSDIRKLTNTSGDSWEVLITRDLLALTPYFTIATKPKATAVLLDLHAYLQGPYNPNTQLMTDNLRTLGLIPLIEPYSALPRFQHIGSGGGEMMDNSSLLVTGNKAITDWIFVELRDHLDKQNVTITKSALIQRNGQIVDINGQSPLTINTIAGDYYVALRHRNHFGVMTATPITLNTLSPTTINFSTMNSNNIHGDYGQVDLDISPTSEKWALWGGDTNGDNQIIFQGNNNDISPIFFDVLSDNNNNNNTINYVVQNVYSSRDANLDGAIIFQGAENDLNLLFFNVLSHPNSQHRIGYILLQQLP